MPIIFFQDVTKCAEGMEAIKTDDLFPEGCKESSPYLLGISIHFRQINASTKAVRGAG
jgi:hypothetical protein